MMADGVKAYPFSRPLGMAITLPTVAGSCTGLPLRVASRFHGAPTRIHRRGPEKRTVCFTRAREYHNGHDLASVTPRRNAHHTLQAQSCAISRTTELHQTRLVPHKGCSDAIAGRDPV